MSIRTPRTDSDATDYVECSNCGHPVETHDMTGCARYWEEPCPCKISWRKSEIRNYRKSQGLPATSVKWGL